MNHSGTPADNVYSIAHSTIMIIMKLNWKFQRRGRGEIQIKKKERKRKTLCWEDGNNTKSLQLGTSNSL